MSWSLARKVSAALLAILVAAMSVTAVIGYYKYEDVMSSLVRSRYSFVVFTIKKKVEDSLNLGFALRQLRQAQETIELEKLRDEQILGIEIYDSRGEVVFNTDRGGIGLTVPAEWLAPLRGDVLRDGATQPFAFVDDDVHLVGLPLVNNLGKAEGAVVLRFPGAYLERELGQLLSRLALELVAIMAVFGVIGAVAAGIMLNKVGRRLGAMEQALAQGMAESGGVPAPQADAPEFDVRFAEAVAKTREAMDHIRESNDEVERLDRLA